MRIESYSQIQQLYNTSKPVSKTGASGNTSFKDKLNISSAGKDMQVAKQAVSAASDIREDKVAALKSAIESGTYDVSGEDFANKIMDKLAGVIS